MDHRIIEFSDLLRQNGLRVSMSEQMDVFNALVTTGLGDRETLKNAMRAALVKRSVDLVLFDELFDLFFTGLGDILRSTAQSTVGDLELSDADFQQLMDLLQKLAEDLDLDLSELTQALLQNDTGQLEKLLREAAKQAQLQNIQRPFQEGRYSHSIAEQMGLGGIAREIEKLRDEVGNADLPADLQEKLKQLLDRRLKDLTDIIKRFVRSELEKQDHTLRERQKMQSLAEKSFYYLTEEEIRRMKEAVAKLAQRLKNVVAIRRKKAKRGRFDLKDTLRKNLQFGGVPFRIQFDRRIRDKPQIVVLCDVSDSVRNVSRFMLQFVYSLQDLYSRVRSFIFVSDLGEITRLFEEREINEAIEEALTGNVINVFAHSDFGKAFRTFHRDFIACVNNKTSVLVLGDARNNYNHPHEWVLKEVRQRAKQVIWLNPENKLTWGFGDSEMDRYHLHCDIVEECRNLNQLYKVIDRLVT